MRRFPILNFGNFMNRQFYTIDQLVGLQNDELSAIDPLVLNLTVAKGALRCRGLDIDHYVRLVDEAANAIQERLPKVEKNFYKSPEDWKHDIRFFRLGIVSWYMDKILQLTYSGNTSFTSAGVYGDPSNLFVHGLFDGRRGSCASMPALHIALCWRLGWPVRLVSVGSHLITRYDDGEVAYNIEATAVRKGGFRSPPDDFYRQFFKLPKAAMTCGSELRSLTAREMLAVFLFVRAIYFTFAGRTDEAELDFLLGRYLFPRNRFLYAEQLILSLKFGCDMFARGERGHPVNISEDFLDWHRRREVVQNMQWTSITTF